MLDGRCPKCGSSEVYRSQQPGGIWNSNDGLFLLGVWTNAGLAVTEDWHTCTCTACGYCEFYLNDPRVLAEIKGAPPRKVWGAPPGKAWSKIVPAGWLADPSGRHELRYWDGRQWTASVSDGGEQSQDPLSA